MLLIRKTLNNNLFTKPKFWLSTTGFNAKVDYYEVLGILKNATQDDIRSGYRMKVKQFHPDINPNYEEKFKLINEAYKVLTNQNLKRQYIKMREVYERSQEKVQKQMNNNQNKQEDVFDESIKNTLKYINVKIKQKRNAHVSQYGNTKSSEQKQIQKEQEQKRQRMNENLPKIIMGFSGLLTVLIVIQMILKYNIKKKYPDLI